MVRKMSLTIRLESFQSYGVTKAIHAVTCPMGDVEEWKAKGMSEDFLIAVNADLPEDEQLIAFIHECIHIFYDDVRTMNPKEVGFLEYLRHEQTEEVVTTLKKRGVL